MTRVAYKPYPCGVVLHALVDACIEHARELREAQSVVVRLHPLAIERTDRPEPRNAIEARLSAQHAVAVCALRGRAGLAEFGDAAATDPELAAFRRRVAIARDDELDKMAAIVNGIPAPAARPMDDARIDAKLRELAGPRAEAWRRLVHSLESADQVLLPD
jgi:2-methylcitrate dehydratase PrpD